MKWLTVHLILPNVRCEVQKVKWRQGITAVLGPMPAETEAHKYFSQVKTTAGKWFLTTQFSQCWLKRIETESLRAYLLRFTKSSTLLCKRNKCKSRLSLSSSSTWSHSFEKEAINSVNGKISHFKHRSTSLGINRHPNGHIVLSISEHTSSK